MANKFVDYDIFPNMPSEGTLFVDHSEKGRSGHLSHALVEYKKGCILSFYSNCSGSRPEKLPGHNGFGWLEYKRSTDGGKTWSEPTVFDYSYDCFINSTYTVSCEKAVSLRENEIIAFLLRNENPNGWEPYLTPQVIISSDGGESWSEPMELCDKAGRVYDVVVKDDVIYALMQANTMFFAKAPEDRYYIYKSTDFGRSFSLHSELPGDCTNHGYGAMTVRDDGALICYEYDNEDEFNMVYHLSYDMGESWAESGKSYVAKRIRNPQIAKVNGGFLLHGRSGLNSSDLPIYFVLYTSKDGIHWDEGAYLCEKRGNGAYYSNNLVLDEADGSQRVLIQSSIAYDGGWRTNVAHWLLDIK